MDKAGLVVEAMAASGCTRAQAETAVDVVFESMKAALGSDDEVDIHCTMRFALRKPRLNNAANWKTQSRDAPLIRRTITLVVPSKVRRYINGEIDSHKREWKDTCKRPLWLR